MDSSTDIDTKGQRLTKFTKKLMVMFMQSFITAVFVFVLVTFAYYLHLRCKSTAELISVTSRSTTPKVRAFGCWRSRSSTSPPESSARSCPGTCTRWKIWATWTKPASCPSGCLWKLVAPRTYITYLLTPPMYRGRSHVH